MQAINVRQAHPGDTPGVSQLRLVALYAHPEAFSSDYETEIARSPAEWKEWVQRADGTAGVLYLAHADKEPSGGGELAGMAAIFRGRSSKTEHSATISGVYVRPAYRRQGIGTQLVQACIDWARAHGVDLVKLAVVTANITAVQFYARHGFRVYGVEPTAIRVHDREYDDLLMAIEL